jgi:hypothetical protein
MAVVWTPDPATVPWFSIYAHETWTQTITATVAPPAGGEGGDSGGGDGGTTTPTATITGFEASVSPNTLTNLIVQTSASGVTLSAPEGLSEAFPLVDLEYQIKRVEYHVTKWEDLPEEADEMINYQPDPSNQKDWSVTVTALLSDGTSESAVFTLRLLQNYDPGKVALKEAVDARRVS